LRPLICVSVMGKDEAELERKLERALSLGGDLAELRLDSLHDLDVSRLGDLISSFADKAIITLRPSWEGGRYSGGEEERIELLMMLSDLKPAYMDLELAAKNLAEISREFRRRSRLIVSFHDFSGTSREEELASRAQEALKYGDIAKIVTLSRGMDDNLGILRLYRLDGILAERLIAFAMGEAGVVTRILAPILGSPIAYSCLPGEEAAPGQLSITHLRRILELVMPR
jgi:3-dehydroquinate dehydratase-1